MIDPVTTRIWTFRGVFVALCALFFFLRLLPLSHGPAQIPGPDMIFCFTAAWVLRRPEFVPAPLIVLIFLLADFLFQRPPGLQALCALLTCEFLRAQVHRVRDLSFPFEWILVAGATLAFTLAVRAGYSLTFVDQPALGATLIAAVMTIFGYPVAVLFSNLIFRVKKAAPRDADVLGHRL